MARVVCRRQAWPRHSAGLDRESAAGAKGTATVEVREIGRLSIDRIEPRASRPIKAWHRAQQCHRVGMAGLRINRRGPPALHDTARIHYVDPVSVTRHNAEVV